jgi:GTPase involved in cell partitioning and DNA repair
MTGRPTKPLSLVQGHRTKAEKAVRKKAESALLTGQQMKEWKQTGDSSAAHKHFIRIRGLLKSIDKNDALYESAINRYCQLLAEVAGFERMMVELQFLVENAASQRDEMEIGDYLTKMISLNDQILKCDHAIQAKRKMLLDIEKENIMTIASALRSIPKKPEAQDESPMAAFLKKRAGTDAT